MNALRAWRDQLSQRAIPLAVLAGAPESPWGFPTELFRHRAERAASGATASTPTTRRVREALPEAGTVLDVGVGGGATSLPLAERAARIVGVDGQADMLAIFADAARAAGVEPVTIEGPWPDAAERTPQGDVAVCGHVVYNVADLGPFVAALDAHARLRVVVELTERHPLVWMNDLWARFHDVRFPAGPTADVAVAALTELGIALEREDRLDRRDRSAGGFELRSDAVQLIRRRLCLGAERDEEIAAALGDRLYEQAGLWSVGPAERTVVTLWWDTGREGA